MFKISVIILFTLSGIYSQFSAAAVASDAAPAIISAIPSGTFAPENARIAPITKAAVPSVIRTCDIDARRRSSIAPQFSLITDTSPMAPAAINANPSGMFTPEKANIAPRARSAPLTYAVISSIFLLYSRVSKFSKIGLILSNPLPPAEDPAAFFVLIVFISSKPAREPAASSAAAPTLSRASDSSYKFSAASADVSDVVPNNHDTKSEIACIILVSTFTNIVNAGMMTLTRG